MLCLSTNWWRTDSWHRASCIWGKKVSVFKFLSLIRSTYLSLSWPVTKSSTEASLKWAGVNQILLFIFLLAQMLFWTWALRFRQDSLVQSSVSALPGAATQLLHPLPDVRILRCDSIIHFASGGQIRQGLMCRREEFSAAIALTWQMLLNWPQVWMPDIELQACKSNDERRNAQGPQPDYHQSHFHSHTHVWIMIMANKEKQDRNKFTLL